jgi:hypothetical protein
MLRSAVLLVFLIGFASAASAASVFPNYDIEAVCFMRRGTNVFHSCVAEEKTARQTALRDWSAATEDRKIKCLPGADDRSAYVALDRCLTDRSDDPHPSLPISDFHASCRTKSRGNVTVDNDCVDEEQDSYDYLTSVWAKWTALPAGIRSGCRGLIDFKRSTLLHNYLSLSVCVREQLDHAEAARAKHTH